MKFMNLVEIGYQFHPHFIAAFAGADPKSAKKTLMTWLDCLFMSVKAASKHVGEINPDGIQDFR